MTVLHLKITLKSLKLNWFRFRSVVRETLFTLNELLITIFRRGFIFLGFMSPIQNSNRIQFTSFMNIQYEEALIPQITNYIEFQIGRENWIEAAVRSNFSPISSEKLPIIVLALFQFGSLKTSRNQEQSSVYSKLYSIFEILNRWNRWSRSFL